MLAILLGTFSWVQVSGADKEPLWSKKSCVGLKSKVTVIVSGFQACS